jgi:hypothetical protein
VTDNIDESILSNLGRDNLVGLISERPYVAASPEAVNPGVNLVSAGEPGGVAVPGQPGHVATPGQPVQPPGVTPSQPTGVDPAEVERYQKIAFEAATKRIETEEQLFETRLEASNLSEAEKEVARLERRLDQTERVNGWLNNRVQTVETQTQQQATELAKRQRAFLIAHQAGLPFDNETVRATLLSAQNPQHMQQLANGLVEMVGQNRANAARQQVTNGVFAAGGSTAGSAGPNLKDYERSGDLTGLIEGRGYTAVNW